MSDVMEHYQDDGLHEECGVFGMYDFDGHDVMAETLRLRSIMVFLHCSTVDRRAVVLQYRIPKDQRARSFLPKVWDL